MTQKSGPGEAVKQFFTWIDKRIIQPELQSKQQLPARTCSENLTTTTQPPPLPNQQKSIEQIMRPAPLSKTILQLQYPKGAAVPLQWAELIFKNIKQRRWVKACGGRRGGPLIELDIRSLRHLGCVCPPRSQKLCYWCRLNLLLYWLVLRLTGMHSKLPVCSTFIALVSKNRIPPYHLCKLCPASTYGDGVISHFSNKVIWAHIPTNHNPHQGLLAGMPATMVSP
ncbi:hypothetical protein Pelo_14313 [Pelomyxa schiedti]|nr:hypothetical protein Pelo_14313 [Pelomyxa schiedti]